MRKKSTSYSASNLSFDFELPEPIKHGRRFIDRTGNRYGRAIVLRFAGQNGHKQSRWECLCDCGKIFVTLGCNLTSGHTQSCGCVREELRHVCKVSAEKRSALSKKMWKTRTRKIPDYVGRKISAALKGKPKTEAHKQALKGKSLSEEHIQALRNRVFSEDHRKRISEANRNRVYSAQHRESCRNRMMGRPPVPHAGRRKNQYYVSASGEAILMMSSYEVNVAKYMDEVGEPWIYTGHSVEHAFALSEGSRYYPDFYLSRLDVYIDPKGYIRPSQSAKYDELHRLYPGRVVFLMGGTYLDQLKELLCQQR